MTLRKHALMYEEFGRAASGECKDCTYFKKYVYRGKVYRKCAVYGITNSDATDWLAHGHACGLFPNKPYGGDKDIVRMIAREPQKEAQMQGQMSIFEMTEGAKSEIQDAIEKLQPAALKAQPEIVRCKDCKHRDAETNFCEGRGWPMQLVPDDGFCDKGERSEE